MRQKLYSIGIILMILAVFFAIGCVDNESAPAIDKEESVLDTTKEESAPDLVEKDTAPVAAEKESVPDVVKETPAPELKVIHDEKIPSAVYNLYPKLEGYLIGYTITNNGADVLKVTTSSEISGYTDTAINTERIESGETKLIAQTPLFKPGILDTLTETRTANLHYKVTYNDNGVEKVLDEVTNPVELYAKDTMLWGTMEDGEYVDLTPLIVAWVTPHAYEIDELIRIAAEYTYDGSMGMAETSESRIEQISAIYYALQEQYSITYINSAISYSANTDASQRIKLPSDAINLASANCIDGTVLFASALENIGINPYIVIVPGHAFLAWGDGNGNIEGVLETTMVGNSAFDDAYDYGLQEYNEEVNSGNFDSGESMIISVNDMRGIGITPMR